MEELGKLIRSLRKTAGLSQSQLAHRHGMSRSTISGVENNTISEVGIRKVEAILKGLGYELTAIPKRRRKTLDELKSVSFHDESKGSVVYRRSTHPEFAAVGEKMTAAWTAGLAKSIAVQ